MKRTLFLFVVSLLGFSMFAQGQTNPISQARRVDWSIAGAPTITHRTVQCGPTISAYSGSVDVIQSAISNCPAGQFVQLGTGTFSVSGGVCLKSDVTLRGMGADKTILKFNGGSSCSAPYNSSVSFHGGSGFYGPNPQRTAAWTAGYGKGTTTITLSNTADLQVGGLLLLDQLDDPDSPVPGGIWMCYRSGICSQDGAIQFMRANRNQVQVVKVTAINGGAVTIEPGLYMPNWRSDRSPGAWWSPTLPISGAGLEDLTVDVFNSGQERAIQFSNAYGNWVARVRVIDGRSSNKLRCHICLYGGSARNTTRDSYFYGLAGGTAGSSTYGHETTGASDNLHENNIWEAVTVPLVQGQAAQGNVYGYNYALNDWYTLSPQWMQASSYSHAIGNNYTLFEGNDGIGYTADAVRGASVFQTLFRNYWRGWDPQGGSSGGKTLQTVAVHIYAWNRYFNVVGNVLGEPGIHSNYECVATGSGGGCGATSNVSVFVLGFSGNQNVAGNGVPNDPRVGATLFRWGNYDLVTGAARFAPAEVPAGDTYYPNSVPASQSLPPSLYLSAKPNWYGNVPWPSIGPDVIGAFGPGNKVIKIPARLCYESMPDDPLYIGSNTVRLFNASACYELAAPPTPLPAPPSNVRILPS